MPADIAISIPKLRDSETSVTPSGASLASRSTTSAEPSVEPSST
jgi:hypothetical protein